MKRRFLFIGLSFGSLALGAVLYLLCRNDTYIGAVWGYTPQYPLLSCAFTAYYLPDFLWGFSLCCGMFALLLPNGRQAVLWGGIAAGYGLLWELAQKWGWVSGTADWWDCLLYVIAAGAVVYINILLSKGEKG